MGMKLYYGGCGQHEIFTVSEDMAGAVRNIGIKLNAPYLPITATLIDSVDGYAIQAVLPYSEPDATDNDSGCNKNSDESGESTAIRHCKKCDFTCETQGELLRHYRECHPKGE